MHRDGDPKQPPDPLRRFDRKPDGAGRLFGLGFQFAGAIVVCVLAGQWADRRFGTDPWGLLAGAMVGFAAGFASLLRVARSEEQGSRSEETGSGGEGKGEG